MPKIEHITLRVKQLSLMTNFYKNVLGMTQHEASDKTVSLGTKEHVLLTLKTDENYTVPKERVSGLFHVAYLLPERKDLAAFLGYLIDTKAPIEGAADHGISEALYLRDPEQNGIEVYSDRPKANWPRKNGSIDMYTEALDIEDILRLKEPYNGFPSGAVIGHVHHQSNEIKHHQDYYQHGLGMDLMLAYGSSAIFLSYEGYHHHVGVNMWGGSNIKIPRTTDIGLDFVTLSFAKKSDIENIVKSLKEHAYLVVEKGDAIYTEDPSGHGWLLTIA